VIAVSHGLTLMILLAEIHGWDRAEMFRTRTAGQGNTAVNVVEVHADGRRACALLACTAHLGDLPSVESRSA
jgi:broad specificity phosphatase PhoE